MSRSRMMFVMVSVAALFIGGGCQNCSSQLSLAVKAQVQPYAWMPQQYVDSVVMWNVETRNIETHE